MHNHWKADNVDRWVGGLETQIEQQKYYLQVDRWVGGLEKKK